MIKFIVSMVFGFLVSGWVVEEYFNDRMVINEVTNIKELEGVNPEKLWFYERVGLYYGAVYKKYLK